MLKLSNTDVATAADHGDTLVLEFLSHMKCSRQRSRACWFDKVSCQFDHQPQRLADLRIAHEDEVIELIPENSLWKFESDPRREPLCERSHCVGEQGTFPSKSGTPLVLSQTGLRIHSSLWPKCLRNDAGSGGATPAANRNENHVDARLLLKELKRERRNTRDQHWFVTGVDVALPLCPCGLLAGLARVVKVGPTYLDLSTEGEHARQLLWIRFLWYVNRDGHTKCLPGEGDGLAVVARRGCNDSACALLRRKFRDEVHSASNFERTNRRVVLVFNEQGEASGVVECGVAVKRGDWYERSDPLTRLESSARSGIGSFFSLAINRCPHQRDATPLSPRTHRTSPAPAARHPAVVLAESDPT